MLAGPCNGRLTFLQRKLINMQQSVLTDCIQKFLLLQMKYELFWGITVLQGVIKELDLQDYLSKNQL